MPGGENMEDAINKMLGYTAPIPGMTEKERLTKRLALLKEQHKAMDEFTDSHGYPSGMKKLADLRRDIEHVEKQLAGLP